MYTVRATKRVLEIIMTKDVETEVVGGATPSVIILSDVIESVIFVIGIVVVVIVICTVFHRKRYQ